MGRNIFYNHGDLSYDEVCERFSYVNDEYSIDEEIRKEVKEEMNCESQYTKEEIEIILKECIESIIKELSEKVLKIYENSNGVYNTNIKSWNETIAYIKNNDNVIELKLTNDFICDFKDDLNYVYLTLYKNGEGIFTECIERVHEEYEFIGSAFIPIYQDEVCFKTLNKEEFVNRVLKELKS
ncbi:hypothetical protein [uncultured Clostridium sp.]|uniref:hypothetical protein n=1 Tax=uncultured Clostridium sp. TaxID=59620 RepID=UPI0025DA63EE|nr:hypothetical protein [uncultured Clostridium sp.]